VIIGLIAFCLAAVVAGRGIFILVAERRRIARLVPIKARLTRNQTASRMVTDNFRQNESQPSQRLEIEYVLSWEYTVGGVTHTGDRGSAAPLIATMPPAEIEVFYDRADPAVSRLDRETPASEALPWFIFAGVIVAVGLVIMVIGAGAA